MPEHRLPDVVEPHDVARRPVPHGGERGPRLLAAKLTAPPSLGPLVDRPRLLRMLDEGVAGPVTLLSAPAGWGKTTLLGAWYRARAATGPTGWLSVESDDTGGRLRAYLRAALSPTVGEPAPEPESARRVGPLDRRDPRDRRDPVGPLDPVDLREFLDRLADDLAGRAEPLVVLLDDLHRAPDRGLADALDHLLRHAGDRLRLVIGSRTDPPLALHRWRLSGELTEIRAAELAFTVEETAELLAGHGVALPAERVGELTARTEGWPAGVRLAALSLPDQPDPVRFVDEFAGDHPDVADYLTEEVLAALPDDAREALRRASIVDRISGGLVDALTGRTDGEYLLAEVDRTTGFVIPVGTRPPTYRCHRLLGELLRAELRRRPPAELRDLHRRVADWAAADGRPADALRHALAAGDWPRATALLTGHWPDLMAPGPDPRGTVIPPVPAPEAVRADPELALACATDRLRARDLAPAYELLAIGDRHEHLLPGVRRRRFRLISAALRLAAAERAGDPRGTAVGAARLLDLAAGPARGPADGLDGADGDGSARALGYAALGSARLEAGDLLGAERELTRGLAEAERSGPAGAALACAGRLALVRAVCGGLAAAERTARTALASPPCRDQFLPVDCAPAYLALAMVALERDRPTEAEPHLALATGPAGVGPVVAALAGAVRARLLANRGELAGAHQALLAARRHLTDRPGPGTLAGQPGDRTPNDRPDPRTLAGQPGGRTPDGQPGDRTPTDRPGPRTPDDRPGSRLLANWLLAMEADLHTAHGDLDSARGLLLPALEREVDSTEPLAVALARAYLRGGDPAAAARSLPDWDVSGGRWPVPVRLAAGLLDALTARAAGDHRRAARTLERVLRLAEPEGFRRVFTRSDPPARDLLAAHLDSGTAYWPMLSDLLDASEPAVPPVSTAAGPDEPLTDRELTVLRYLQSILSNVEIASEMSLSVNTVKTHVRNIYRKLDASRRREAVRRARELRLI